MRIIYLFIDDGGRSVEKGDKGIPDTIPESISWYFIFGVIWHFHI